MKEQLKVLEETQSNFNISRGIQTETLLRRLEKLNNTEKNTLVHEAAKILENAINPVATIGNTTGIAIGYVQSGKTMSFTTLTTLASDNGFRIIIYLAGGKLNLLEQTTKRLRKDLLTDSDNSRQYKVFQNPSSHDHSQKIKNALSQSHKPTILITVLKHYKHINELTDIFKSTEFKEVHNNNGILIIDDEADQASLNTYARKNSKDEDWEEDEFSSTYASILDLKGSLTNHTYIQYTATPQAPLLINILDLLSPKFHVLLTPGDSYTGAKTFFIEKPGLINEISKEEVYHHKRNQLPSCPESLIEALQVFLIGVAIVVCIEKKESFLSMMVHADREQNANKLFIKWVKELLDNWNERLHKPDNDPSKKELIVEFISSYNETVKTISKPPSFEDVMPFVLEVILDTNPELVIQGSKEIDWSNAISHILVGADMLNRGYTVEGLMVSYMPRYSIGKSNADTIQQRCRFFGYKRNYIEFCRVYLPKDSIEEYKAYVEHEEIMRQQLSKISLEEFERKFVLSPSMNPTRFNILSEDLVRHKLNGWRQINALQHIEENKSLSKKFLADHKLTLYKDYGTEDRNHQYAKVSIAEVITFLTQFKISNMPDTLRKSSTIEYLRYMAEKHKVNESYIFEMAFKKEWRERELISEPHLKINNIWSGRSSAGNYPGDKAIKFENSLCIQIHKVKLKHKPYSGLDGKIIYTLGIYYPESLAHSFVTLEK